MISLFARRPYCALWRYRRSLAAALLLIVFVCIWNNAQDEISFQWHIMRNICLYAALLSFVFAVVEYAICFRSKDGSWRNCAEMSYARVSMRLAAFFWRDKYQIVRLGVGLATSMLIVFLGIGIRSSWMILAGLALFIVGVVTAIAVEVYRPAFVKLEISELEIDDIAGVFEQLVGLDGPTERSIRATVPQPRKPAKPLSEQESNELKAIEDQLDRDGGLQ